MAKTFDFLEESLALLESDRTDVTDDEVRKFIENELFIKDKMTNRIIPFKFNSIQDVYWKQKSPFDYILKYRKGGFSTLTMAEYFARAVLLPDQQVVFLAHRKESVSIIFQTMHIFYQRLSDEWKERINGKRRSAQVQAKNELRFSKNGSQIIAMTGASPDAMRGMTPSMVHMSELAFWRAESVEESVSSILGSIPPNGRARIETTPSSAGTWAYQEWQRAAHNESQFNPRFYTWWDDPWNCLKGVSWTDLGRLSEREQQLVEAYNLSSEQIAWRRKYQKAQGTKFIREYPEDAETCWVRSGSTVFDMDVVIRNYGGVEPNEEQMPGLTVHKKPEIGHAYIIGADPAGNTEDGDFSAAVCFDEDTGEEMFSYYNRLPIHDFGSLLHRLGEEYNQALISPERNNHGHAVVQYLTMTEPYDNLSVDEDGKVGIQTTPKSKTKMIANLDEYLWHDGLQLKSRELFRELAAYVYDERMRANAGIGHDDLVSATLVAIWTLQQMSPRDWDQGTGAVVPQPKQIALPPPPQMPATIDENEALKYSVMQMMVTSGLPFQNVGGSLFGDQGLQYPKVGCPTCGSTTSTMKNGFWTCDGCGGVSVGRLFNETPA